MSIHINEDYCDLNGLIAESNDYFVCDEVREEVKEFLSKFYTWDEECEEFDDTPKPNYREYEIKVKRDDECCDDEYINIISVKVSLPTDEDAKELADLIDGKVVDGLNADGKSYCVTYTKKIVIKANSREDAKRIFDDMEMHEADRWAAFGGVKSIAIKKLKKRK